MEKGCPRFSQSRCCLLKAKNAKFRIQSQGPYYVWEEVEIMIDCQAGFGEMEVD